MISIVTKFMYNKKTNQSKRFKLKKKKKKEGLYHLLTLPDVTHIFSK